MIKAVFLDFDGTVFSHASVSIPASAYKAIDRLREKGIKVFLCTGRAPAEFKDFDLRDLHIDGRILSNGQMVLDRNDEIIYEKPVEGELKDRIITLFKEKNFPMYMVTRDDIYLNDVNETVYEVQDAVSSGIPRIKEYEGENIYMASAFFNKKEDIETIYELEKIAEITWWHQGAVDIVPKGISKADGISKVCQVYGIKQEETLGIGDGENDVGMLKHCDISIAMSNASPSLKQIADYVTDDIDDDGLYNALKHYQLI